MPVLVKRIDDYSYRARADRSLQSGRVLEANTVANVAHVDVGMIDFDGNGVPLEDVAFSPQTRPRAQDTVSIVRTNSSPYSHVIGGGAGVGGANSGQVVKAGGAVTSLAKSGDTALQGDVTLSAGSNVTLTQVGQNIAIASSAGGGSAPDSAHYVTTQAESGLSAEFNLGGLTSGILKHTVSAGVSTPATAAAGTDYAGPPDGSTLETSGGNTRIKDSGVTLAKIANIADQTILGNNTGGAAAPVALTASQTRTVLGLGTAAVHGRGCLLALCIGFTPTGTGADVGEIVVPHDPDDGTTSITWNVRRITLRVNVAGGAPVVVIEKSTVGNAAFGSGNTVGTITFSSGDSEGSVTSALGTVASGNKLRFNVTTLGTATGWTIEVLLGA